MNMTVFFSIFGWNVLAFRFLFPLSRSWGGVGEASHQCGGFVADSVGQGICFPSPNLNFAPICSFFQKKNSETGHKKPAENGESATFLKVTLFALQKNSEEIGLSKFLFRSVTPQVRCSTKTHNRFGPPNFFSIVAKSLSVERKEGGENVKRSWTLFLQTFFTIWLAAFFACLAGFPVLAV